VNRMLDERPVAIKRRLHACPLDCTLSPAPLFISERFFAVIYSTSTRKERFGFATCEHSFSFSSVCASYKDGIAATQIGARSRHQAISDDETPAATEANDELGWMQVASTMDYRRGCSIGPPTPQWPYFTCCSLIKKTGWWSFWILINSTKASMPLALASSMLTRCRSNRSVFPTRWKRNGPGCLRLL